MRCRLCRLRHHSERGSVTLWFALASFVMIVLVGLTVDLTGQVHAQQRARDVAAQAARAGGQQINAPSAIRGLGAEVNGPQAVAAAKTYLTASGIEGSVGLVNGTTLVVRTSDTYQSKFLSIIGVNGLKVTGSAEARLVRVVEGDER